MNSLKELYKIGNGPSSSHTMGPQKAACLFKQKYSNANKYIVHLYGSLGSTGKGHLTDQVIKNELINVIILFEPKIVYKYHTNGMLFEAYHDDTLIGTWLVFSVGGGELKELNEPREKLDNQVYSLNKMADILQYCNDTKIDFYQYVIQNEGEGIINYGKKILNQMFMSVEKGINTEGVLPGKLKIKRRAKHFYDEYLSDNNYTTLEFAASLAVSEENANGGVVVTAPTCGASGVLPGVLYTYNKYYKYSKRKLIEALLVGGLIGNIVKTTGSISGAEVGCQGEVGTACAMGAAAICYLKGGSNKQIEYASEIAFEHHLGLTCDPVMGYVQIPCIERNAMSCKRAIDCANFALCTSGDHYIKLDDAIEIMLKTGKDIKSKYRETSKGGLATKKFKKEEIKW